MKTYRARRHASSLLVSTLVVLVLVLGGISGTIIFHLRHDKAHSALTNHRHARAPSNVSATSHPPLTVSSIVPVDRSVGIVASDTVTVTFSSPLGAKSPLPTLSPQTSGSWKISGSVLTFTPRTAFDPLSEVILTVPGGVHGVRGTNGSHLMQAVVETYRIANGSVLRLQQLLSLLDYSPLAWTPKTPLIATTDTVAQNAALYDPPDGTFSWRNQGWPRRLRVLWAPGADNVFTKGLVMSFQADHALTTNGRVSAELWSAVLEALATDNVNTGGYNFAIGNKAAPQSLTIYHDGRVILTSPANTGIAGSPTPDGTFPVNTRLRRQIMHGTNPDGSHYADLVQYIAYFHGNDAVHFMNRADYGIPQSLGCIELPLADAARAWPYLAYGTLVSIIN
jgi:hypothetical protein